MSIERNFIEAVYRVVCTSIYSWVLLLTITNHLARSCMQSASVFPDVPIARNKESLHEVASDICGDSYFDKLQHGMQLNKL